MPAAAHIVALCVAGAAVSKAPVEGAAIALRLVLEGIECRKQ